jgi:polyphosphate glucokinase
MRDRGFGIDIGGSGIKAARVDLVEGALSSERVRVRTPRPATPEAVARAAARLVRDAHWNGPVGIAMPGVVKHGVVHAIANFDRAWVGVDAQALFEQAIGQRVVLLNDADSAGLAEVRFGAARGQRGVVIVLVIGTGIGSALLVDGQLLPATEFGHLELRGKIAEQRASDRVRREKGLSWKAFAARLDELLAHLAFVLSPDLFVLGGGISRKPEKFLTRLTGSIPVMPAALRNDAGIVGAALAAVEARGRRARAIPLDGAARRPARRRRSARRGTEKIPAP